MFIRSILQDKVKMVLGWTTFFQERAIYKIFCSIGVPHRWPAQKYNKFSWFWVKEVVNLSDPESLVELENRVHGQPSRYKI